MTTKEVLAKLEGDEALAERLSALKTPEEVYAMLREHGLTDTMETFRKACAEAKEAGSRLSPEELDAIVGGSGQTVPVAATGLEAILAAIVV